MTSPNHAPVAQTELNDPEKGLYSIAKLNDWRTRQYELLTQLRGTSTDINDDAYIREFNGSVDEKLDEYLEKQGIDRTSPNYDEVRRLFRDASIDKYTEDEWGNSPASRGIDPEDHLSESDRFEARIADRLGRATATADAGADLTDAERQARDAEFAALEAELDEARELYAAQAAKRQGRFFGTGGKEHDRLKADYEAKLHALGRRHMAEHDDYDADMKNVIATTILFDEQEKLRNLTTDKLQGTKVSRMITWMNKGSTATRIAKGVAIGVGAGLAGSFLAGAVGAGVIAGGTIAATRFARGFALKDKDRRGMDRYVEDENGVTQGVDYRDYEVDGDTQTLSDDERMKSYASAANKGFQTDTVHEQEKRRKAALYGTAMIGAGALIGYGIHEAADRLADSDLTVTHWVHKQWDEFWNTPNDQIPSHVPNTTDGHLPDTVAPNHHPNPIAWTDFAPDARAVVPGEGGFQTLHEMGIPEAKWEAIWQDAGSRLHDEGKTYVMADGRWGWQRPMSLSNHDLRIIAGAARRNGVRL